ncbi:MAG: branched-chain amino acid transport system II carrier protein [Tissierellia bacterium]|nr:branched-chain amino acid transport system II carrier protein [Tissierellia bacterium]
MSKKTRDVIVVGFALFAIFFGAGNLIFPPYLGVLSGASWGQSILGFLITDPVLPILGVIATAMMGGKAEDLGKQVGPRFSIFLAGLSMLAIGPFFSVPRTAATTHEIAISQVFPQVPIWVTTVVFFALTLWLVINPSKIMERVGKFLTPGLILVLTVIILAAIFKPAGTLALREDPGFFLRGFKEGYQTMDALGASLMTGVVVSDLMTRGYREEKIQRRMAMGAGLVAFILLAYIYTGLAYLGASSSSFLTPDMDRTAILLQSVQAVLGPVGAVVLALAVSLACLTTSVGLTAACGNFFSTVSKGALSYRLVALVSVGVSFLISLLGVEGIINLAVPILEVLYPVIIALIVMTFFDRWIVYNWTYTGMVAGAFVCGLIPILNRYLGLFPGLAERIGGLPLNQVGMEWLLPALALSLAMTLLAKWRGAQAS